MRRTSVTPLRNFIGGTWTESANPARLDVVNPATEEVVAQFPAGSPLDVNNAVTAATVAQPEWHAYPVAERVRLVDAWADGIAEHAAELAELECQEMGKPAAAGRFFVAGGVAALKASLADAATYPFETSTVHDGGGTTRIIRNPIGVAAVITPWNFPVAAVLSAVGALLAAGNTIVVKPSEKSPLSTARLFELLTLPPGVANLVLGDGRAGEPLTEHPGVGLIHFTGSVPVGRAVGAKAGHGLRRALLELGGKDPVIVDTGVDPIVTAQAVAHGAFVNTGQICTSMERIYVHRDIATPFVDALVTAAETYTLGDGNDEAKMLGPLVDARQRDLVHAHVTDAVARGAKVHTGGVLPGGKGFSYPPTVLTDVDDTMLVMTEETFGPVAPVRVVDSFEDGLRLAGRSRFGLAATIYTNNPAHAKAAETLPAGIIWINQWQGGGPDRVFEPAGDSGVGAIGGHAAYDAATRPSAIHQEPGLVT
jgi:acyl-CoA reductase-like NAD-dependent aldehyde dehydrogenase